MKKLEIADSTLAVIKKVGEALFMYAEGISSLRILQAVDVNACAHLFFLCDGHHVPRNIWEEQLKGSLVSSYKIISSGNDTYTALLMDLHRQENDTVHSCAKIWDELADIQARMDNPPKLEHVSFDMYPETILS